MDEIVYEFVYDKEKYTRWTKEMCQKRQQRYHENT